jgi:glycolate oxidase FAD binding subunit
MGTRASGVHPAGIIPAQLANACADVALAGPLDAVGGRQARFIAAPSSTAEAAALLTAAAELGLSVVPRGSGSRLDWGVPPDSCDLIVETRRLDQILEHAAGDLVVSAQAGVRLGDLATVLSRAGQRLALDPPGHVRNGGGTVGGLIATGVAGPLRFRYGGPRDLLIGITVVRADGTVAKSGGKVVKNVAGYDLGKLYAGSYGTLGLITEATFRLHPAPTASAAITLDCPNAHTADALVQAIADSQLAPSAIELDWPSAAAPISVAALLEGDEDSVAVRADRLVAVLARTTDDRRSDQIVARQSRTTDDRGSADGRERPESTGTILRIAFWVGQLVGVLRVIRESAAARGLDPAVSGSAAAGVLQVDVSPDAAVDAVVGLVAALRAGLAGLTGPAWMPPSSAGAIVLYAPAEVREAVDMWGPVPSLGLMGAVKDQFDPEHRMAPGRFAGGI